MYIKRFATNANITLRYPNNCVFQNQYYTLDKRGTQTFLKVHLDTNLVDYTLI